MNFVTYAVIEQSEIWLGERKLSIKLLQDSETKKYYPSMSHYAKGLEKLSGIPHLKHDGFDSADSVAEFMANCFVTLHKEVEWIENEYF